MGGRAGGVAGAGGVTGTLGQTLAGDGAARSAQTVVGAGVGGVFFGTLAQPASSSASRASLRDILVIRAELDSPRACAAIVAKSFRIHLTRATRILMTWFLIESGVALLLL